VSDVPRVKRRIPVADTAFMKAHAEYGALNASRSMGAMLLAGAFLAVITAALPPRAVGSDAAVLAVGALAGLLGAYFLRSGARPSDLTLGIAAAVGTILIAVATREGGPGTGTADNEILFVWVVLFVFNFLPFRHALAQLALIGATYAWTLVGESADIALTRWLVAMVTLAVSGLLVMYLRVSRDRLMHELAEHARSDALTGILNRRSFEERANIELARANRDGVPVALLAIDIDGFKRLNDEFGHPAGDAVLRDLAAAMGRYTRQIDAVARLGGDEFVVLLPGSDTMNAQAVAERLLSAALEAGNAGTTLSIGIAVGRPGERGFAALWERADAAMYEAKRSGGNAIRISEAEPETVPA